MTTTALPFDTRAALARSEGIALLPNPPVDRLTVIRSICRSARRTFGKSVIVAGPSDVAEEAKLAKQSDDNQSILDEETEGLTISPELARATETVHRPHVTPNSECLTLTERLQLARELATYRAIESRRWALALPLPSLRQLVTI